MQKKSLDKNFWKDKKVLVTGHTGFKGGWLSLWLSSMGAKVSGLSLPPEKMSFYHAVHLESLVENFFCDIGDYKKTKECFEKINPDIVFHLAAQPLVLDSYLDPIYTYQTNVMGTLHLLELSKKVRTVKAFINVTTDKCYENKNWEWGYRENDPLGGHDPYSSSKACSELLTNSFRLSFCSNQSEDSFFSLASLRAGNVFGGGDWAHNRLIPDAARALAEEKTLVIRNPHATRPWQFVLEPLRAYIQVAEKLWNDPLEFSEAWNVGPDDKDVVSVETILKLFYASWGNEKLLKIENESPKLHEGSQLKLDSSKLKSRVGWKQNFYLEDALEATSLWYKTYYRTTKNPEKMRNLSLEQISNSYENPFYLNQKDNTHSHELQ